MLPEGLKFHQSKGNRNLEQKINCDPKPNLGIVCRSLIGDYKFDQNNGLFLFPFCIIFFIVPLIQFYRIFQ